MKSLVAVAFATITAASSAVTVANERNASSFPGDQAEVAITADPSNPQILLGVSGGPARTRTYTSTDGGKTWSSRTDVPDTELAGDGIPAIDRAGHEYLGFVSGSLSSAGALACCAGSRWASAGRAPPHRPAASR